MGYDFNRGRLDLSTHPFTIDIHPSDVRITTRVSETNFLEALSSTIHEVGHGLYEQGLDSEWAGIPFGTARSMGARIAIALVGNLYLPIKTVLGGPITHLTKAISRYELIQCR